MPNLKSAWEIVVDSQLIVLTIATRKKKLTPPGRLAFAKIIELLASGNEGGEQKEAVLSEVISKELFDALKEYGFDFKDVVGAGLVLEEGYAAVDRMISVCMVIALAPAEVMAQLAEATFCTPQHWTVWGYIQGLGDKQLEGLHQLYSAAGQGSVNWSSQKGATKRIVSPALRNL